MAEVETPSPEDLIAAYAEAEAFPDFLPRAEVDRIRHQRRKAALATIQGIRTDTESTGLAMHYAYRPEITSAVSVHLGEESDWEAIAKWCGGTIDSGPDGTDSGEWDSWIALPNGDITSTGMWITKEFDGQFRARVEVAEPDETTLRQAEAVGWQMGAATALSMANYAEDGTLALAVPNPGQALLPSNPDYADLDAPRAAGHFMRVILQKSDGLTATLTCTEPTTSPCRKASGDCDLVAALEEDRLAVLEDYQGAHLSLLHSPIEIVNRDECEMAWTLTSGKDFLGSPVIPTSPWED